MKLSDTQKFPDIPQKLRVIGTTPIRPDGVDKVTGRARFGDDIHLPGMLYGKVLRSPHAHAVIKSIDPSKALALPGVHDVITAADFPELKTTTLPLGEAGFVDMRDVADCCLARNKVLYDGHAIAVVAADNPHLAEEATQLIQVDFELLTPVMDVHSAMADDAPVLHEEFNPAMFLVATEKVLANGSKLELQNGDIDKGFAEADVIVEREFTTATVHQGYIEPHFATANWDADNKITVWTTTQGQFTIREQIAAIFDMPMSKINVIPMEIGGGFGGKDQIYIEHLAAMLSKRTGAPVKMAMSRNEVLRATGPTSGTYIKVKMGAKKDGRLVAADVYCAYEAGAYPGAPIAPGVMTFGLRYNIPNIRLQGYDIMVNKPKSRPYRAPGTTQSNFAAETVLNELAEMIGMDPVEFRLKNAMRTGDRLIMGFPCPPIGGIELLEAVRNHPHYTAPLDKPNNQGRGMAYGFWFGAGLPSSAEIMVNSDGTVQLCTGSCDLSGTRMTLAMQAAEALGIDVEDVSPIVGDTESVAYTFQSVGSRTTFATGIAVYKAAQKILAQMKERAALIWETDVENIEVNGGTFSDKTDENHRFNFKQLAGRLETSGGPVSAQVTTTPEGVGFQLAAHLVDIEVDTETGKVDILRYTAFQDAGKAVHPDYVAGQMQGGVVQGIGWALNEEYFYNDDGRLANASLLDYRMPTSLDVPMIETVILETPNPGHPYGVRGVGEVPIVPPPAAIANAIYDAIGVRMVSLPMSPGKILEKIWAQEESAA